MRKAKATYWAKRNGWFWVVPEGNKSLFFGPYRTRADAERQGPKDDLADQTGVRVVEMKATAEGVETVHSVIKNALGE